MSLFLGTHTNKIDKKGRVSVPAPFRQALSESSQMGLFVFKSVHDPALSAAGLDYLKNLQQSRPMTDLLAPAGTDMSSLIFMSSIQPAFDPEGRIALPADFTEHAEIEDKVSFVGMGDTFQLWSPALLEERVVQLRNQAFSQITPNYGGLQ